MKNLKSLIKDFISINSMSLLFLIVFLLLIASFLCCIVKFRLKTYELGYKIELLEKEKEKLKEDIMYLDLKIIELKSCKNLEKYNKKMNLNLVPLEEWISDKR